MASLLDAFATAVAQHADRVAIVDGRGRETTFRDLDRHVERIAARWHARGVRPGDRVLLAMNVTADLYASLAALWSLGATVVLPEPAMGLKGLRHAARVTGPKAFCASGWFALLRFLVPELRELRLLRPREGTGQAPRAPVAAKDIALISFTSGTTGAPKAIPRSHGFLMAQYAAVAPLLASDRAERDLVAFPVFTLVNLADGRTSVLPNWKMSRMDRLTPARLAGWLTDQAVSRVLLPPALCEVLLAADIPPGVTRVITGGGPVFPDIVTRLSETSGVDVTCVYGSTEAEPIAHLDASEIDASDAADMARGMGLLVGKPVSQVRVRIVDHEVQVAGEHVNGGYLDPAHDAENKVAEGDRIWHRTGDAGRFDDQGRLWLLGRIGSEIAMPSGPLFPFAIEVAARHWPGVRQSALMGRDGAPVLVIEGDSRSIADWERAARDFGVARIETIADMPMDLRHRSKIDRARLRDRLSR